ncbi:MAG: hypothetical protein N2Z74_06280, partial [Syntrophales bacterium]|nr:hypothetical protein [Syntrophales bacterium]
AVAVASLAALIRIAPDGTIGEARLAWGSVGPTVGRPASVEAILIGRKPSTALWSEAAAAARETVSPIDDLRASASYRRLVAGNLLVRLGAALPGPS